ncbi:MAG: hypothetical protein Unbinned5081contig1003_29 [Prokaryotic dsDNA virus sp.]|nr:MAG: hypothetical protein Unbinned5081contig1003_29 [Prokaryotic dsDNA virus sp.]|tara:strand:- start:995 stop:1726 length:732 start_codon:yes stop_codon:yes gene_type:complete
MGKRFTDTEKYSKAWFRKLPPRMKCFWDFVTLKCDTAGIWELDMDSATFHIGEEVTLEDIESFFGSRIEFVDTNKIWIVDFVKFQYGELKENYNPHRSAIKRLDDLGLLSRVAQGLVKTSPSLMDKGKYKGKGKDQDKGKDKEEFDFETLYDAYPRKEGKQLGLKKCKARIKTNKAYLEFKVAINNYSQFVASNGIQRQFVKKFCNFLECWEDYKELPENNLQATGTDNPFLAELKQEGYFDA